MLIGSLKVSRVRFARKRFTISKKKKTRELGGSMSKHLEEWKTLRIQYAHNQF